VAINEAMARRFFEGRNPLGKTMIWGFGNAEKRLEVVAVVRDVKQDGPRDEPTLRFYVPYFQEPDREVASVRFIVRTIAQPDTMIDRVRDAIRAEDQRLTIVSIDIATDLVNRTVVRERMIATLSAAFGLVAVLLACVGLYGLISHRVLRRTTGDRRSHRLRGGASQRAVDDRATGSGLGCHRHRDRCASGARGLGH